MTRRAPTRRTAGLAAAAALAAGLLAAGLSAGDASAAPAATQLALSKFVGTYRDVETELGEVAAGPLVFDVSSRSNELRIHRNLLELLPQADGTVAARLEVELEGWGDLLAMTAAGQRLTDRVTAPRQTVRVTGRLAIEPTATGFAITYLGGSPALPIAIESDLGEQILTACDGFAAMPLLGLDCGGLESAFRSVDLPMPAVGDRFELGAEHLTPSERDLLAEHARAR